MDQHTFERLREELSGKPYEAKWEVLRHVIEHLYIEKRETIPQIAKTLREQVGFYATDPQYKYYTSRKWALKKRLTFRQKEEMITSIEKTVLQGKPSARITCDAVTKRKLIRHLKLRTRAPCLAIAPSQTVDTQSHTSGDGMPFVRLFMSWCTPWGPLSWAQRSEQSPIFAPQKDGWITTPSPNGTPPPEMPTSPQQLSLSLVSAVQQKIATDRARLFVAGDYNSLLQSMNKVERRTLSSWMHQFWLRAYKTAKYWGGGPKEWTQDLIGYADIPPAHSKSSPSTIGDDPMDMDPLQDDARNDEDCRPDTDPDKIIFGSIANPRLKPSRICFWSIHEHDEFLKTYTVDHAWTAEETAAVGPFPEKLIRNLQSNSFSNLTQASLPISIAHVAKEGQGVPEQFIIESVRIAIMSGNMPLLDDLFEEAAESEVDIDGIFPLHLAATYLEGAVRCCLIFDCLISNIDNLKNIYVNSLGHTVLDALMMTILRSHSACEPGIVDPALKGQIRFPGEDIDICGRWAADSECIQALYTTGKRTIPFEWKHKFCHTSALAICHSTSLILSCFAGYLPNPNHPSGLFRRICGRCGRRFDLLPLHTLMLVALQLSLYGKDDEDLFGILACLLCFLVNHVDPSRTAEISDELLNDIHNDDQCSHEPLTPSGLTARILAQFSASWPLKLVTGWRICYWVLERAELEWILGPDRIQDWTLNSMTQDICLLEAMETPSETSTVAWSPQNSHIPCSVLHSEEEVGFEELLKWGRCRGSAFGMNRDLAKLWAAVQTEMLTYRHQNKHDPWVSENFNMENLLQSLESGEGACVRLITEDMMEEYCKCGKFLCDTPMCPTYRDVQAWWFSNMDTPRATYIGVPDWQW